MLAHLDPLPGLKVQGHHVPRSVTAEGDLAAGLDLQQQQRHAGERTPDQALAQRMQADLEVRVLPEQHVVLEVHRHAAVQGHVQDGHELTLEPVADSGGGPLRDLGGQDLGCRRH